MERGDGKGRRSPGGVFFYLARQKLPKEQRAAIFNDKMPREPKPPGWVPEQKRPKESERSFPRRRVFEVNPGSSRGPAPSRPFGSGSPGSTRAQWSPPPVPPGTHVPPQLPNAVARGKAKLGILDSLGSLHPDDQYLVLLELLGDLHAVYGASADNAAPEAKSIPESKPTRSAAAAAPRAVEPPAPSSEEPPPSPKRKAPARKSAKSG